LGRIRVLSTAATALVVAIAAGLAAQNWIREEWWIWQIEHRDWNDLESRQEAVRRLGEMRSAGAVPVLVPLLRDPRLDEVRRDPIDWQVMRALARIGEPAIPALLKAGQDVFWRIAVVETLIKMDASVLPELRRAEQEVTNEDLKRDLARAIAKLEPGEDPAREPGDPRF
jgi:hypothetical protein